MLEIAEGIDTNKDHCALFTAPEPALLCVRVRLGQHKACDRAAGCMHAAGQPQMSACMQWYAHWGLACPVSLLAHMQETAVLGTTRPVSVTAQFSQHLSLPCCACTAAWGSTQGYWLHACSASAQGLCTAQRCEHHACRGVQYCDLPCPVAILAYHKTAVPGIVF